jgi:hypothetical protein
MPYCGMRSTCPGTIRSGSEIWSWLALKMRGHSLESP